MQSFENLNQSVIGLSQLILKKGIWRDVRGVRCLEYPTPLMVEITNPTDRYVTIPERKWNKTLPWVESLWILLGLNDLDTLPGNYVNSLYKYSDNGRTWRAGYGPRIRCFEGTSSDYDVYDPKLKHISTGYTGRIDQLKYVVDALKKDINTRQAIIEIGDPVKDDFLPGGKHLKVTKDYPCTRSLQFMVVDGKLNLTTYIRSNDLVFGFSAVNVFNFTLMQEYIASILNIPVGKYYHVINNLHVYDNFVQKTEDFAKYDLSDFPSKQYTYPIQISSLEELDSLALNLLHYERDLRFNHIEYMPSFGNTLFEDWAKVFYKYHYPDKTVNFSNPLLNTLYYV